MRERSMDMEQKLISRELFMWENLEIIKDMEKENSHIQMEAIMKEILLMVKIIIDFHRYFRIYINKNINTKNKLTLLF